MKWYQSTASQLRKEFTTHLEQGLSSSEAQKRLTKYGPNRLEEHGGTSPLVLFFRQFKSFIIYILLFAVAVSLIGGEYVDAVVILFILLFNAIFGFIQEFKAEKAIQALAKLSGFQALVVRDGKQQSISADHLVPGDILLLAEGNKVPADCRLLGLKSLHVNESSLTGESQPVSKHLDLLKGEIPLAERNNMVFSGTTITRGRARALVVGTGMSTEIGKIADMINQVEAEPTPLQRKLQTLGTWVGTATLLICFLVFLTGVIKDQLYVQLFSGDIVGFVLSSKVWFLTAIALAVAAVPEGLPAIVTVALALGVRQMVKRNALIRRLPSVETLGETTIICSDKTGTLTENKMTVRVAWTNNKHFDLTGEGYSRKGALQCRDGAVTAYDRFLFEVGVLCNDASYDVKKSKVTGDPTEAALLVSAEKSGVRHGALLKARKRVEEEPFDSVRKMMSTINRDGKKLIQYTKGAPERILACCDRILIDGKVKKLSAAERTKILKHNTNYAKKALRVLAFAYRPVTKDRVVEKGLIFVGLQGMIDPPHAEVAESIARCHKAGIRVVMVTGDNGVTAQAIAGEIGIEGAMMLGADFAKLASRQQARAVKNVSIFSRVEPAHKMRIVELLQKQGNVVAMTGDGVNDAPALKKADIGIAMGIVGTDVAKEASEMILQDDNFTSIVNAIEEGRGIYGNIQKFVNYLLSSNAGEVLVIFLTILFGFPLPLTALMLLWINLVTDGFPALALSMDPKPENVMDVPPKKSSEQIMDRGMLFSFCSYAVFITAGVLGVFLWSLGKGSLEYSQTLAFTTLFLLEIVRLHGIRVEYKVPTWSNVWLIWAVLLSVSLQLVLLYTPLSTLFHTVPLGLIDWTIIILTGVAVFFLGKIAHEVKEHWSWFNQ